MTAVDPTAHLQPVRPDLPLRQYLAGMWQRRDFAYAMPFEELRVSHQNTLLGNIWHLGNPLISVAVFYLIFGVVLGVTRGIDNYILWLAIGVFAFGLTTRTVLGGAMSIAANRGLMRSIRFPRALLTVSVLISRLLTFGFELAVIVIVVFLTNEGISWRWLLLPLVIAIHSCLNLGGAFIAARLNDAYRDVQQIIPFIFRLLMYMTGVIFPVERFLNLDNPIITDIIRYNPIAQILTMYRWVFMDVEIDPMHVVWTAVGCIAFLLFGFVYFRAAEWRYGRA
jgi:teichoic acid transport system permease protein